MLSDLADLGNLFRARINDSGGAEIWQGEEMARFRFIDDPLITPISLSLSPSLSKCTLNNGARGSSKEGRNFL